MSTVSKQAAVQHADEEIYRWLELLLLRAVKHQTSPATSLSQRKDNCRFFSVSKETWQGMLLN